MAERRKWFVSPIVLVAFLIAAYVGSFAAMPWFVGHGVIKRETADEVMSVTHAPIFIYERSGLPGAGYLSQVRTRWYWIGHEQRREIESD